MAMRTPPTTTCTRRRWFLSVVPKLVLCSGFCSEHLSSYSPTRPQKRLYTVRLGNARRRGAGVYRGFQSSASALRHADHSSGNSELVKGESEDVVVFGGDSKEKQIDGLDPTKLPRVYVGLAAPPVTSLDELLMEKNKRTTARRVLFPNATITLLSEQSHYLTTVLRLTKKQQQREDVYIRLWDDPDQEYLAKLELPLYGDASANRRSQRQPPLRARCIYSLVATPSQEAMARLPIQPSCYIAVALPYKNKDRCRWLVEKTTELGCTGYIWLDTEYSQPQSSATKKLPTYALSAADQCERRTVPRILEHSMRLQNLLEWVKDNNPNLRLLWCRERSPDITSLPAALTSPSITTLFVVGPEGGWSSAELALWDESTRNHAANIQAVSLGPHVLRTETACVAAVAAFGMSW